MRSKGDIETIKLDELTGRSVFAGVEVDIEHVGPAVIDEWRMHARGLALADLKRVIDLRKQFTEKDLPAIYRKAKVIDEDGEEVETDSVDFTTPEGEREHRKMHTAICAALVKAVRGWPALEGVADRKAIAAELDRLSVASPISVVAVRFQTLEAPEIFTEGPSDVRSDDAAAGELGPELRDGVPAA